MRSWAQFSLVIGACMLGPASVGGQTPGGHTEEYEQEVALTRKAGLPVTPAEIAQPLPPREQNAAPLYRRAWDLKKRVSAKEKGAISVLVGRAIPAPEAVEKARRALAAHKDILDLYHQAASLPYCVFPRDWSQGPGMLFPEYAQFRDAARWLNAEAYLQLVDGQPRNAVRTQALGFRIATHAASDPILIAYLVGVAMDAITLNGLQRILYVAADDPAVCSAVAETVEKDQTALSLSRAMPGEVVTGMLGLEEVRKGGVAALGQLAGDTSGWKSTEKRIGKRPANWDALMDSNGAYLLRVYRTAYLAFGQPYPDATASLKALSQQVEQDEKRGNLSVMLAAIETPVYESLQATAALEDARARVTRAAAAVLAWRDRRGALPDRLDEAQNPPPADPFSGRPLGYRREGEGFVIFSVGESGHFDGGQPDVKPGGREALFRYPRPKYLDSLPRR